jgi:Uma2 family endonuclease
MPSRLLDNPPKVTPVLKTMTDEQFMNFQASRPEEERWELIEGVPIMMTPTTNRHERICHNLTRLILDALEARNETEMTALTNRGITVPRVGGFRPSADVAVLPNDDGGSYHDVFFLAAEVLSQSNTQEHIELKRKRYMQHPKNLHVLIISQYERHVEHYARSNRWAPTILTKKRDAIDLPEFGCRFTLQRLYKGTPLE